MSFLLAVALGTAATFLAVKITRRFHLVYKPSGERWSKQTVSLHGGIAIYIAFITTLLVFRGFTLDEHELVILGCGTVMLVLGLIDDLYSLMPKVKLTFQALIATVALSQGIIFVFCDSFWLAATISTLWIIGLSNAINLLDNMDGASAGIVCMSLLSLALLPHHTEPNLSQIAIILAGSVLGFLFFNFNPAKIFMGDSGSLFLGTTLALYLIKFSQSINL